MSFPHPWLRPQIGAISTKQAGQISRPEGPAKTSTTQQYSLPSGKEPAAYSARGSGTRIFLSPLTSFWGFSVLEQLLLCLELPIKT